MGSIVSSGVGSGLDVSGLVQKLVQAEGQTKTLRLNQEEAKVQSKMSALGSLRSALTSFRGTVSTLKDIAKFQGRQVTLSGTEFLSATANGTALPGTYAVEVQQLAAAHKLQSADFAAATTAVGTGTLRIATGAQNFDIAIDSSNNTLAGIAQAINQSAAGAKVTATVISGNGAARLTLTAKATGAANAMTITESDGDGGLAALTYPPSGGGMTQITGALDAQVLIDGIAATSSTNTLSGAITGVDIVLKSENEVGETTQVSIGYDRNAARRTIEEFVKSYNAVVDAIGSLASYNSETKEGGPLFGDAGVRNIVYQLRRELTTSVAGLSESYDMLGEIGVSAGLNGKLSLDTTKLDGAFTAGFDSVGQLFAKPDTGIAVRVDSLLATYLDKDGLFDGRTAGLKTSIDDINDRREALNERLAALQTRYTKQFNALDGLLAKLQGTSGFLTQQLSQLPGFTRNKN